MGLSSHPLHEVCQEVLKDQCDAHVRRNSNVESWEPNPQWSKPFMLYRFSHRIENMLIWHNTICIRLHLLNFRFGIVERQTAKWRQESWYQTCTTIFSSITIIGLIVFTVSLTYSLSSILLHHKRKALLSWAQLLWWQLVWHLSKEQRTLHPWRFFWMH